MPRHGNVAVVRVSPVGRLVIGPATHASSVPSGFCHDTATDTRHGFHHSGSRRRSCRFPTVTENSSMPFRGISHPPSVERSSRAPRAPSIVRTR